ncbi:ferrous iron transport protein A [Paenibacillus sp. J5C_2022]|uniref:FeoA family protein n=1 Tax=Paenibacillus sp. J5C2022 TaxID=2977129 RepID=UPI0021CF3843|nr:FeoA family protein [Paenibacillus sp. J5C2022]MCU6707957.1 ferrous iron transport protein A [Paenibacillus sp. J5C2022]
MPLLSELQLKTGDVIKVKDLSSINRLIRKRLNDMGVVEASELCYKCQMPFGGPLMLECNGQRLGIRYKEAACIEVEYQ